MLPPDQLRALATAFRDAIERADRPGLGIRFESFPTGSCGDASPLLGRFLKDHGAGEVTYVLGERGELNRDWTSHAWLRVDGYIVDITDLGREALERAESAQGSIEDEILGGLSESERVTFRRLLVKALEEHGGIT